MSFENDKVRLLMSLRGAGVGDTRVLGAIERTPREIFVPESFQDQSYDDIALPIGHEQTLSQPRVVALMTEALEIGDRHKVLEVGTGSGYQTAVLAKLCRRVYTVERHRPLLAGAQARFDELKLYNITTKLGDGTLGWPEQAPFDRIIVTAAAADVPPVLAEQLELGGRMVVPIGDDGESQSIILVTRNENGLATEELRDVAFVPLIPEKGAG